MSVKHFKASEYAPESPSGLKPVPFLSLSSIDRKLPTDGENRLLPVTFILEKGMPVTSKALGPATIYIIEGELHIVIKDVKDSKKSMVLTAGDVLVVETGAIVTSSTPSIAKGFGAAYCPANVVATDLILPAEKAAN